MSVEKMSMGYVKDGFAFLIDGFELSKPILSRKKGFPPRLMTAAIRRGGMCERRVRNNHMSCVTSRPPTKTTLIFSLDSTITLSRICLTI